ncbi:MAG: hypothetical protein ACK58L_07120 [Planctomycetota bacterium]
MNQPDAIKNYSHTQSAPLCLILYGCALACLVVGAISGEASGVVISGCVGLLIAMLGSCFHELTVEDQGQVLSIHFGPVPLFRRTVNYVDMSNVEIGRTLLIDGWGIHRSIRGGWVWNLWGRDCVMVSFRNGQPLRIGTDDAENLLAFLRSQVHA